MKNKKILIIGGDKRLCYTSSIFADNGFCSYIWNPASTDTGNSIRINDYKDIIGECSAVILPIPAFSSNGKLMCKNSERIGTDAESVFKYISKNTIVFGGNFNEISKKLANEYNLKLSDYGAREEFSLLNAVPTAEAAIFEAMKILETTIDGNNFTVIGYGRVGRALAARLKALGGAVTVCARRIDSLAQAETDGMKTVILNEYLQDPPFADVIYNTVPYPIINYDFVGICDCNLYIDLASIPGGFTEEARTVLGDKLITALSLPGKYSPETAGRIIYKTVIAMYKEAEK